MRRFLLASLLCMALPAAAQPAPEAPAPAPTTAPAPATAPPISTAPLPGAPASFAPLVRQLLPAVVNISTVQGTGAAPARPGAPQPPQAPPGSPFEEFFRDFFGRPRPDAQPQPRRQQAPPRRGQSLGSGFIIDPSGIIITNNHVIEGAEQINVILQDNTTLQAELLGTDPRTDLAVLRVRHSQALPYVRWGDSDAAEVGDWVLAIGNPFGLGGSVTAGIISARGRDIRQGPFDDFIQTDAAINRGNSGGPLFNMAGEVIGINTAIYSPTGGSIGIGFSIPSNLARGIVRQLAEDGRVRRGWLGVNIQQMTDEIADGLGLPNGSRGALIARAQEGSPAAAAGLRSGDVILRFNDQDVREMRTLPRIVAETPVGTRVPVVIWRDGREMTVEVTLGELPADPREAAVPGAPPQQADGPTLLQGLGLTVATITPELRAQFRLRADAAGVVVTEVAQGSQAAERDLRAGTIILEVQQERVSSPADVQRILSQLRRQGRATALFLVETAEGQRFVPLRLGAN